MVVRYLYKLQRHFRLFKWNLLGWHWLIKLCRLQVYGIMMHHLYLALCAHHPKSGLLSPYIWTPVPFTAHPLNFPSGNHRTVVCVYEFLFVCLVCLFVAFSFKSYIRVKSYGSWLFLTDWFCLAWYSQDPSMLSQMAAFHHFLWLSSVPLYICTASLSSHLLRTTSVVSMS